MSLISFNQKCIFLETEYTSNMLSLTYSSVSIFIANKQGYVFITAANTTFQSSTNKQRCFKTIKNIQFPNVFFVSLHNSFTLIFIYCSYKFIFASSCISFNINHTR